MRAMSFALTTRQYESGEKDVTRRLGWLFLKPGERFMGCRKSMGLKRGEKRQDLGISETISTRREPLNAIDQADVIREGFPGMTPAEFVAMFCEHNGCLADTEITRIEFKRVDADKGDECSQPSTQADDSVGLCNWCHRRQGAIRVRDVMPAQPHMGICEPWIFRCYLCRWCLAATNRYAKRHGFNRTPRKPALLDRAEV